MQFPRPGICIPQVLGGFVFVFCAEGFGSVGEYLYVPDMSSVRICPYIPATASVFGWLEQKEPYRTPDGKITTETDICLRSKLRNLVG
jgi:hypothetical protein